MLALRATFVAHRGKRRRGVRRVTGSEKSSRRRRAHGFFFALRIRGEDLRRRRFCRRARLGRRTLLTRVSHRRIVSNSSAHVSIRRDRSRHLPRRSSREGRLAFRHRRAPRRRLLRGFPRRRFRQRRRITISDHRRLVRVERHRLVIILLSLRRHRLPHRRPLLYVFILEHDEFVRRPSSPDRRTRRFHRRRRRRHRSPAIAHGRLPRLIPVALRLQSLRASARLFQHCDSPKSFNSDVASNFPSAPFPSSFPAFTRLDGVSGSYTSLSNTRYRSRPLVGARRVDRAPDSSNSGIIERDAFTVDLASYARISLTSSARRVLRVPTDDRSSLPLAKAAPRGRRGGMIARRLWRDTRRATGDGVARRRTRARDARDRRARR